MSFFIFEMAFCNFYNKSHQNGFCKEQGGCGLSRSLFFLEKDHIASGHDAIKMAFVKSRTVCVQNFDDKTV